MTDPADRGALQSMLMSRSLSDADLLAATDAAPDYAILPDAKDVDGVCTADPATAAEGEAQLIPRASAAELLAMDTTLPIDRIVLELMANAKHVKEIQIVNGLTRGNVTKALRGEHVGTIVHAD